MRILHVVRQFHPGVGGLESYVRNMAEQQKKLGHECAILTLNKIFHGGKGALAPHEVVDGLPVYRVPFLGRRRFFLPAVPRSFLKRYDVIHVHNTDGFFDAISLMSRKAGKPIFATTHGGFFHTKTFSAIKRLYFHFITRKLGKNYRAIFAISQHDYDTFKGVNDNLILKPNAIMPAGNFIAAGDDFVYLGRLAKHKNVEAVIRTFALLKTRHGKTGKLHIIGPEWDVPRSDLSSLAKSSGAGDDVIFHGFIAADKMSDVLRDCGWFISASSFEGFGMSMLEAMSVGLIPFVQPNESFLELIAAGKVGASVNFGSPGLAASQISERMDGVTMADRQKARDFALLFSWEKLAEDTVRVYREHVE
jgi:alpha-1,3-mannosyltransferase